MATDESRESSDSVSGLVSTNRRCEPCFVKTKSVTSAKSFCKDCLEYQCEECVLAHNYYSYLRKKEHDMVNVDEMDAGDADFNMADMNRCKKHENKKLKLYCKEHDQLICTSCDTESHRKCGEQVLEIDKCDLSIEDETSKLNETLCLQIESTTTCSKMASDVLEMRTYDVAAIEARIDQMKDNITRKFDELKENFKADVCNDDMESHVESTKQIRDTCERTNDLLKSDLDLLNKATRRASPRDKFVVVKTIKRRAMELAQQSEDLSKIYMLHTAVEFSKTLEASLNEPQIGTITLQTVPVHDQVKLKRTQSVSVEKLDGDGDKPCYSGLAFLGDGRIITVDNANSRCIVLDSELTVLGSTVLTAVPLDICVLGKDKVATTHCGTSTVFKPIMTYTITENNEASHDKNVAANVTYYSVSAIDHETVAVSTCDNNQHARKVSLSSQTEHDFDIQFPEYKYEFNGSRSTYVQGRNLIVVTDRYRNTVSLYNVCTKREHVIKDARIQEPCDVCSTSTGFIFVCSSGTQSIVQISPGGHIVGTNKLEYSMPYSIDISRDDKQLLVFYNDLECLRLELFALHFVSDCEKPVTLDCDMRSSDV